MRNVLRWSSIVIGVLLWLSLPAMLPGRETVFVLLTLYVPVVVGIALLAGFTGQVSVGQAAFFGLGAYGTGILSVRGGLDPWVAMPLAVVAAALVAWVVGKPVLMLRGQYVVLATLGFNVIFTVLATQLEGITGGASGLIGIPPLAIGDTLLLSNNTFFVLGSVLAAISVLLSHMLVRSRVGRALQAIEGSEVAAATLGVDRARHATEVFVFSAVLAASSGALYAQWVRFISPSAFALDISIELLIMAVIGGIASIGGAVVGTAVFLAVRELLRDLGPWLGGGGGGSAEYELVAFGLILAVTVTFLPRGLGPWLREKLDLLTARLARSSRQDPSFQIGGANNGIAPRLISGPGSPLAHRGESAPVTTGDVTDTALTVTGLTVSFGGLTALKDVSVQVGSGSVLAVIGPNGAGKTTFLNALTGVVTPDSGRVQIADMDVTGQPPHKIAAAGVRRTFQTPRLFPLLTAGENVQVGLHTRLRSGFFRSVLKLNRREERRARGRVAAVLATIGAEDLADRPISSATFAQLRLVELARALVAEPRLLLLDEPASGLDEAEREQFTQLIRMIRATGTTVVLIEHDIPMVMDLADRIVVLHHGVVLADGTADSVARTDSVIDAYLGNNSQAMSRGRIQPAGIGQQLLELQDLRAGYGQIQVLDGVDLKVRGGHIVGLLGPNGAGKTTLTRAVMGLLPSTGERLFDGKPISSSGPVELVGRGLALVPEGRELLPGLSVHDHLLLGAYVRRRKRTADDLDRVYQLFPQLAEKRQAVAEALSGGQQQMLAIGRALMSRPQLLVVDEPLLGLAPLVVEDILRAIVRLANDGVGVLLAEQNASTVLDILDYVNVLEQGRIVLAGDPGTLHISGDLKAGFLAARDE